ncbi:MAG: 50S ribosomal protein L37ae [Nanoarchaeota archaeon]|nr:50S ribosomal protein L37ae [Nanoarchaeota archaeon]
MVIAKKYKSVRRFGSRYGRGIKEKIAVIESEQRKKHKCPYCGKNVVKRVAVGIWYCKACQSKFTGKAYTTSKKIVLKKELETAPDVAEKKEKTEKEER